MTFSTFCLLVVTVDHYELCLKRTEKSKKRKAMQITLSTMFERGRKASKLHSSVGLSTSASHKIVDSDVDLSDIEENVTL